jgi:formylmethanofuran dehydrogenase subunit A
MLLIKDPWRVFLTTDHPNGGPFTCYPHLLRLLMDRTYRLEMLERLHPLARERTLLQDITREYTLDEVAIVTRCAPARVLGLEDRGSLRAGCVADLAIYEQASDWQKTFESPKWVIKSGRVVIKDSLPQGEPRRGQALTETPQFDMQSFAPQAIELEQCLGRKLESIAISPMELQNHLRTE